MPRIPQVDAPEVSTESPSTPRLGPQVFGTAYGDALERFGNVVDKGLEQVGNAVFRQKANGVLLQSQKTLQDYESQLKYGEVDPDTGQPAIDPQTGQPKPAPDPATHAELFQQKIDQIRSQAEQQLSGSGEALNRFSDEFGNYSNRALLNVKENALSLMHQKIRAQYQQNFLDAANASVNASDIERSAVEQKHFDEIQNLVDSRVMTPEEGFAERKRFVQEVELGHIRKMAITPQGTEDAIRSIEAGEFHLPADQAERQLVWLVNRQNRFDNQAVSQTQKDERDLEKSERKGADAAYVQALELDRRGQLNGKWLDANLETLKAIPSHVKAVEDMLKGGSERPSNSRYVNMLRARISQGDDTVTDDIEKGMNSHSIDSKDYADLWERVKKELPIAQANGWYANGSKTISRIIRGMQNNESFPAPGKGTAESDAQDAWREWRRGNPNATSDEASTQLNSIIRSAAKEAHFADPETALPAPKNLRRVDLYGENGPPLLDLAGSRVEGDFAARRITKQQHDEQIALIQRWKNTVRTWNTTAPMSGVK